MTALAIKRLSVMWRAVSLQSLLLFSLISIFHCKHSPQAMPQAPRPTEITLHQQSRELEIAFDDGNRFRLSCEFLRVYSPSAEVRGHGPGQEVLQTGKRLVNITEIEPVGTYAIKPTFSDGHDTGLYSWDYLHDLGVNQHNYWQTYLTRIEHAKASRG
jgi:DUF971 family protein